MKFKNRVYGVAGIGCINSNWNADFTGYPKSLSNGAIFGSDKAFKYSIKKLWENEGKKILYSKYYNPIPQKDKKSGELYLQTYNLSEKYENIFNTKLKKNTDPIEILKNLFSAEDVLNFGATFASSDNDKNSKNLSITGAVQVMQGMNIYDDTETEVQDILSPFVNPNKENAKATSIGKKITVNEAHYLYGFTINPQNYDIYNNIIDNFEGYTEEAYNNFKRGCCIGATALNTNSKAGCENEFALFVKLKEDSYKHLPDLARYIKFEKTEDSAIYDLTKLGEFLSDFEEDIESIEVYANKFTVDIELGTIDCEIKDIFE